jgi:hypothetical protein
MSQASKHTHRWYQFSLGTMLVVLTLAALVALEIPFWTEFEALTVDIQTNVHVTSGWDIEPIPPIPWTDSTWFWKAKRIAAKLLLPIAVLVVYLAWETRSRIATAARTTLPDPRRWFQFETRTIFLAVTVLAVWLGWEMNWIKQRHAVLENNDVIVSSVGIPWEGVAPSPLGWFGESGIGTGIIFPSETTDDEVNRVRRLFPETSVTRWSKRETQ